MLQSNWGDAPSRVAQRGVRYDQSHMNGQLDRLETRTGWNQLSPPEQGYVDSLFAGRTLPQAKELISFSFCVDGVSRACTHQLVRTRIGAAFMQHGGRDNDWRHRPFRLPETIRRACMVVGPGSASEDGVPLHLPDGRRHCITDPAPLEKLVEDSELGVPVFRLAEPEGFGVSLRDVLDDYLETGRYIYAALVDAGIPWQDARFLLPDGMTTYIHCNYSYAALEGMLANRLEHVMQWEINCVAQLMLREIKMMCPPLLSKYLGSRSDKTGRDEFAGLESWPPVGKYPVKDNELCVTCGHPKYAIWHDGIPHAGFEAHDFLPPTRTHRPEQNPFWVLHPDSMAGGPIVWVPTNGTYPKEF